jgi:hypothetical protein
MLLEYSIGGWRENVCSIKREDGWREEQIGRYKIYYNG